ncbi:hypothetical protein TgHK011_006449 [Trichoderma gracile]|nr:hypothetical protein TgHK011_006449 [Trichoderma gracile]
MPANDVATSRKRLTHEEYSVGWICALGKEKAAAEAMLDEIHDALPPPDRDPYTYTLGSIRNHNIVIACLPEIGTNPAANLVTQMINTFPSVKFCLMVGIGGGIPQRVRLGDIVVSKPTGTFPGVVQWDLGKSEKSGFRRTGALDRPPMALLTALVELQKSHAMGVKRIPTFMKEMEEKYPPMVEKYTWSPRLKDPMLDPDNKSRRNSILWASVTAVICEILLVLFKLLSGRYEPGGQGMVNKPDPDNDVGQPRAPEIHYGLIASGNQVIKDSAVRDRINKDLGGEVLCLEMEAAGLMNNFPCIVVRGICDYADAQKNKDWQEYAAALAAAFTKELLQHVQSRHVAIERPVKDVLLQRVHEALKSTQADVSHLKAKADREERNKMLDWLSTTTYGDEHAIHSATRTKGTGEWILQTNEFRSWLDGNAHTLLCQGMPGSGKTIIASVVIDHLTARSKKDPAICIAYIYCSYKRRGDETTEALLRSMLRQLASNCDAFPLTTKALYRKHADKHSRPSQKALLKGLKSVMKLHSKVYVVIDAVDECQLPSIRPFLHALFEFQTHCNLSLLATSRFIPEIKEWFTGARSLFLEIRAQSTDIAKYLEAKMRQSSTNVIRKDPKIQEEIKRDISEAADGMFLLARIYLNLLRDKTTGKAIRTQLKSFRADAEGRCDEALTAAYKRVIKRINKQKLGLRTLAMEVLSWVTFAKRSLTISELRHGLATEKGMKTIEDDDLPDLEDIGRVCVGLVTVDEKTGIIELVHYTTQEYFESSPMDWFVNANATIFDACITYLSFSEFDSGFCRTDEEFEERQKNFPFCDYATSHWGHHISDDTKPSRELLEFLNNQAMVDASVQTLRAVKRDSSHPDYSQEAPRGVTGLHLAAHFGLIGLPRVLLGDRHRHGWTLSSLDSDNQTPLFWAARNGQGEAVSWLIDSTAALERRDRHRGATPLIWAAQNGHENVVRILLEAGSKLNAKDLSERTPLSLAAYHKHDSVIRLLLERGGIVHPNDESGKIKLLATRLEHHKVIEMLYEHGSASACDGEDKMVTYTAEDCSAAAMQRSPHDDSGIDEINVQDRALLLRAAERGDQQVVEELINSGKAHINARDQNGATPLICAARKGHDTIVSWLLKAGADVNIQERRAGETALTLAIETRHEAIIQALLDGGANVNNRDHTRHTPLHTASWQGSVPVMQMLLDRKVDVNARNNEGHTPIFTACAFGHIDLVRKLLDAGADIEARDEERRTPLFFAAALGHSDVVDLLLQKGANAKARNKSGRTAMFAAIGSGEMRVVRLLLDASHIDDVHKADEEGVRPIDWAEESGHEDIIRLLHHRAKTI